MLSPDFISTTLRKVICIVLCFLYCFSLNFNFMIKQKKQPAHSVLFKKESFIMECIFGRSEVRGFNLKGWFVIYMFKIGVLK